MIEPQRHRTEFAEAVEEDGRLGWWVFINAAVAQRIRASVYGTEGRGFESLQPHFLTGSSGGSGVQPPLRVTIATMGLLPA